MRSSTLPPGRAVYFAATDASPGALYPSASPNVFEGLLATEGWDFCSGVGSPLGYFGK
jgi:hypothetical protein